MSGVGLSFGSADTGRVDWVAGPCAPGRRLGWPSDNLLAVVPKWGRGQRLIPALLLVLSLPVLGCTSVGKQQRPDRAPQEVAGEPGVDPRTGAQDILGDPGLGCSGVPPDEGEQLDAAGEEGERGELEQPAQMLPQEVCAPPPGYTGLNEGRGCRQLLECIDGCASAWEIVAEWTYQECLDGCSRNASPLARSQYRAVNNCYTRNTQCPPQDAECLHQACDALVEACLACPY